MKYVSIGSIKSTHTDGNYLIYDSENGIVNSIYLPFLSEPLHCNVIDAEHWKIIGAGTDGKLMLVVSVGNQVCAGVLLEELSDIEELAALQHSSDTNLTGVVCKELHKPYTIFSAAMGTEPFGDGVSKFKSIDRLE